MKKMLQQRKWQLKMEAEGRCPKCGKPVVEGKKQCQTHLDYDSARHKK